MKNSAWLIVFIAAVTLLGITGAAQPALAQHHGHIGGGGTHGGGFHGSGFQGGGFHGGAAFPGGFHAGHPGGFHGGVGFPRGIHNGFWPGGFWGYPRYGYGWGFGIGFGIGIGIGWGSYWPYYGYTPFYPYPSFAYPAPLFYPPYPYPYYPYPHYPYYRYYPLSRSDVYHAGDPDRDRSDESPAVHRYTRDRSNDKDAEYQVVDAKLQQLPPERRRVVQNVVRALRAMPPDARQRQIDAGRFRNLSPEERELLNSPAPVSAAQAQTAQSVPQPPQQSALVTGR